MYDSERDSMMVALKALGYSMNTTNENEIQAAFNWLVEQRKTMDPTYAIDIYNLCKAIGIKNVNEIDAYDVEGLEKLIASEVAKDEISVIITKGPCVLLKTTKRTHVCKAIPEKCKKCGMCLKPGCPAVIRNEDGTITIDENQCNGCGLCMKRCHFDAIAREEL